MAEGQVSPHVLSVGPTWWYVSLAYGRSSNECSGVSPAKEGQSRQEGEEGELEGPVPFSMQLAVGCFGSVENAWNVFGVASRMDVVAEECTKAMVG